MLVKFVNKILKSYNQVKKYVNGDSVYMKIKDNNNYHYGIIALEVIIIHIIHIKNYSLLAINS